jgi:hypothetical protein
VSKIVLSEMNVTIPGPAEMASEVKSEFSEPLAAILASIYYAVA